MTEWFEYPKQKPTPGEQVLIKMSSGIYNAQGKEMQQKGLALYIEDGFIEKYERGKLTFYNNITHWMRIKE